MSSAPGTSPSTTSTTRRRSSWSCFGAVPRCGRQDGTRQLAEGEAVHFPTGPDGAHAVTNDTDEPVRFLMASTLQSPEVVEYPDLKQITAQARTGSQTGERLWLIHDVEPPSD